MTTENQTTKPKQVPNFYIFDLGNPDELRQVGTMVCDEDDGHTVLINGKCYRAFSPDEAQILEAAFTRRK